MSVEKAKSSTRSYATGDYSFTRVETPTRELSLPAEELRKSFLEVLTNTTLWNFCCMYGDVQLVPLYRDEEGSLAYLTLGVREESLERLAFFVGVPTPGKGVKVVTGQMIENGEYNAAFERLVTPRGIIDPKLKGDERLYCRDLTPLLFEEALIAGINAYVDRV